jgi:hypothetical protein
LEQKKTDGEGEKATVFEEIDAAGRVCTMMIGSANGPAEVNVAGAYSDERPKHWEPECGRHEKDISDGQDVADNTHDPSRRKAADRGEALIATEPFSERIVPNQSQADGGDSRPDDASGRALDDSRGEHRWKVRPQPVSQHHQNDRDSSRYY